MFEKVKSVLGATTSVLCALSAAVGVFAWMNITPEMVGQVAYDTMKTWLPFVMFALGAVFGAGATYVATKRKAGRDEKAREMEAERMRRARVEGNAAIIRNMDFKEKAALFYLHEHSHKDVDEWEHEEMAQAFYNLSAMGYVEGDTIGPDKKRWTLSAVAMEAIDHDPAIFNAMESDLGMTSRD